MNASEGAKMVTSFCRYSCAIGLLTSNCLNCKLNQKRVERGWYRYSSNRDEQIVPEGNFPKLFRFKIIVPFHKIGLIGLARQALKNGQKKAKFAASKI